MTARKLALLTIIVGFFASCAPIKDKRSFSYFSNLPKDTVYTVPDQGEAFDQKLKSGDVLSIRVSTLDAQTNLLFNEGVLATSASTGGVSSSSGSMQSVGYKLDSKGDVYMPLIGKLRLQGKTQEEAQALVTEKISAQVKNPIVAVRLLNAQVMVMGEVMSPGLINISDRKTTLLEALGRAGDVSISGDKKEVLVIRTTNGVKEHAFVNMNDIAVLNSPYYFLHQDDVVVVYPNKIKERTVRGSSSGTQIASLTLGFVGTGITILNFLLYLRK